jgi:prepilin-type N-terminal cleavage/methylation domain-containing protein
MNSIKRKKQRAFTLVEMLVTVAIIGFIVTILSSIFSTSYKQYRIGTKSIDLNQKASLSVQDFEKIARGATTVIAAESSNFEFYSYLKNDSHPAPSKIDYYLEDGKFYRSMIAPVDISGTFVYPEADKEIKIISDNVISPSLFTYYNDANSELGYPVQTDVVRMVKISIQIDDDIAKKPDLAEQSTAVQLRNLKNNL